MATVIGKVDCPAHCGGKAEVREAKSGTLQIFHQGCMQAFVKNADSVKALRAHLAGEDDPKPALPAGTPIHPEANIDG